MCPAFCKIKMKGKHFCHRKDIMKLKRQIACLVACLSITLAERSPEGDSESSAIDKETM